MGFQGFIEGFDYANGIAFVNGYRVQIDDPAGKFSIGYAGWDPEVSCRTSVSPSTRTTRPSRRRPHIRSAFRASILWSLTIRCVRRRTARTTAPAAMLRIFTMDPLIDPATGSPPVGYNGDPTAAANRSLRLCSARSWRLGRRWRRILLLDANGHRTFLRTPSRPTSASLPSRNRSGIRCH